MPYITNSCIPSDNKIRSWNMKKSSSSKSPVITATYNKNDICLLLTFSITRINVKGSTAVVAHHSNIPILDTTPIRGFTSNSDSGSAVKYLMGISNFTEIIYTNQKRIMVRMTNKVASVF
ncbi:hypothetical protein [Winogradskyella tangerina]|uniref:hypothetical protein n=1 Tax=Winogradskyella tangerina TaxID=2023240 RepID=UPI0018E5A7AC|nr:hypothetical protein [Winogradskyella tangerina]